MKMAPNTTKQINTNSSPPPGRRTYQTWLTYSGISINGRANGAKSDKIQYSARSEEKQCCGATHALLCCWRCPMLVKGWSLTEAGTGDDQLSAERAARLETACKRWRRWMQFAPHLLSMTILKHRWIFLYFINIRCSNRTLENTTISNKIYWYTTDSVHMCACSRWYLHCQVLIHSASLCWYNT